MERDSWVPASQHHGGQEYEDEEEGDDEELEKVSADRGREVQAA